MFCIGGVVIKRILIIADKVKTYSRSILEGISEFVEQQWDWCCDLQISKPEVDRAVASGTVSGIISVVSHSKEELDQLREYSIPLVFSLLEPLDDSLPFVGVDDTRVGAMAGDHFLEIGFRKFAFIGQKRKVESERFTQKRKDGFFDRLGLPCEARKEKLINLTPESRRELEKFLRGLSGRFGIFCDTDVTAKIVSDVSCSVELQIPDQMAVAGVDNDLIDCLLTYPSLTSIELPGRQIGRTAADLLDQLMNGGKAAGHILLPPLGVKVRTSTRISVADDPVIFDALSYINKHACSGLKVQDLIPRSGICRSLFERRFRKSTGKSPLQEIHRVRIDAAKSMLVNSMATIHSVAEACGFCNAVQLIKAVRDETGLTPGAYRRRFRR